MRIKDIGGESGLIERIKKNTKLYSKNVITGIGDDTAVLKYDRSKYLLFTTDMLVENTHFSLGYYTPKQIGMKAIEQNVSDVAAMGGLPRYGIVSLTLPKNIDVGVVDGIFDGINNK